MVEDLDTHVDELTLVVKVGWCYEELRS